MHTAADTVLVSLVTHNDEPFIERCLESVLGQSVPVSVRVFDSASGDRTVELAKRFPVATIASPENVGYCRGHNANLGGQSSRHALFLNADCVLDSDFVARLVAAVRAGPGIGMAGGKLWRLQADGREGSRPVLDSTGIYFTPAQRHFDRGAGTEDRGQFDRPEQVFGITGAALLCTREFIEDVRMGDELFDEDFFAYREDADLAWRGRLRGWAAVYEPRARGGHYRRLRAQPRAQVDRLINFHSVKNRYLMRTKNLDWAVWRRCFPYMWLRDLGILGYIALRERDSFGALREVRRLRPRTLAKRRHIQSNRRAAPEEIAAWFSFRPVSRPLQQLGTRN
ncbi:MAG: glycosyltransferase [Acidobacteriota bacterium]